jgi:signal transduction histidine kinase
MNAQQPTFQDLELLAEVSQLLTEIDLDTVLSRVISLTAQAVGATKASLFLHEDGQIDWGHIFTVRDLSADESVRVVSKVLDTGFAGWVYRNKRGDIINNISEDERWIVFPDDTLQVGSALCVPFIDGQNVMAVVTLVHETPNHFTSYHLRLLTIIANQATIAVRNAQLVGRLMSQRRQLEAVLQSIGDALIVLNHQGIVMLANDVAMRLLRAPSAEALYNVSLSQYAQTDSVFVPIAEIVHAGLTSNDRWMFETRSERLKVDYQVTMRLWRDGDAGGYVVVMHDVTQLRDLSRFKDEMLRVASHDLRSPLALITGYADMISLDTPDPESPVHEYAGIIKSSVERMSGLVEELLRVERVRSSPLELQEKTDLEALVKVVIINMRPSAEAKKQRLESQTDLTGIPRIMVDSVLVRQAMENFVSNAIKYTPSGGIIVVNAYYDHARFYFSVKDTGIGIPEEHQQYVFESFYRVPMEGVTEKGSGLGLSLVKNIITRHGGDVWLKSRVGKGSEFGFWLPLLTPTTST